MSNAGVNVGAQTQYIFLQIDDIHRIQCQLPMRNRATFVNYNDITRLYHPTELRNMTVFVLEMQFTRKQQRSFKGFFNKFKNSKTDEQAGTRPTELSLIK